MNFTWICTLCVLGDRIPRFVAFLPYLGTMQSIFASKYYCEFCATDSFHQLRFYNNFCLLPYFTSVADMNKDVILVSTDQICRNNKQHISSSCGWQYRFNMSPVGSDVVGGVSEILTCYMFVHFMLHFMVSYLR